MVELLIVSLTGLCAAKCRMRQSSPGRQLLFCRVADSHFRRKWYGLELGPGSFFQAEILLVRCI